MILFQAMSHDRSRSPSARETSSRGQTRRIEMRTTRRADGRWSRRAWRKRVDAPRLEDPRRAMHRRPPRTRVRARRTYLIVVHFGPARARKRSRPDPAHSSAAPRLERPRPPATTCRRRPEGVCRDRWRHPSAANREPGLVPLLPAGNGRRLMTDRQIWNPKLRGGEEFYDWKSIEMKILRLIYKFDGCLQGDVGRPASRVGRTA